MAASTVLLHRDWKEMFLIGCQHMTVDATQRAAIGDLAYFAGVEVHVVRELQIRRFLRILYCAGLETPVERQPGTTRTLYGTKQMGLEFRMRGERKPCRAREVLDRGKARGLGMTIRAQRIRCHDEMRGLVVFLVTGGTADVVQSGSAR